MTDPGIQTLRGREWAALGPRGRKLFVENAFAHWRTRGFPHYELSNADVDTEFANLLAQPVVRMHPAGVTGSNTGLRLANFFQPQMWSVGVSRYMSPADVFYDDAMLRLAIERSLTIWPDRFGANPATLRRMLKTFPGVASVSNFRPTLARSVIEHFSKEGETVLDFSSGYGGRVLGALVAGRRYLGIEPCLAQVKGLRRMIRALRRFRTPTESEILRGCAEDVLPNLPDRSVGLVFSSPPYFNWERYDDHRSQSFIRYRSYAEWRDGFLAPTLQHSARVLYTGAHLVLNLSGRRRQPSSEDAIDICKRAGLTHSARVPLLISRIPYLHPRNDNPHKSEELLIFIKGR